MAKKQAAETTEATETTEQPQEVQGELFSGAMANVTQLAIMGQGSDKQELHIGDGTSLVVVPLTNPVTPKQISDILAALN